MSSMGMISSAAMSSSIANIRLPQLSPAAATDIAVLLEELGMPELTARFKVGWGQAVSVAAMQGGTRLAGSYGVVVPQVVATVAQPAQRRAGLTSTPSASAQS
jgi:hypothetical protein